jgi:tungstate transport system permease protein
MSASALSDAFDLLFSAEPAFWQIVARSLQVTVLAVIAAALLALPVGAALALFRFPGRNLLLVCLNTLMGFPPILAGLLLYILLSRSGPLGFLGLLFTPGAMIAAQALLAFPIILALTRQTIEDLWQEYEEHLRALGSSRLRAVPTLLWEARYSLVTSVLAGLGRAAGEVGAVLIVGGNIAGYTRMMTTAIALETSKGDLPLAIALGLFLILIKIAINLVIFALARVGYWVEARA